MTLNPAEELVEIVDRDNRPIGALTRRLMREQGLIHRAAYILVFNTAGELFLQKRTLTKDIYPGYWDMAAGGVVLAGESYEAAARRELQEELGVTARLRHLCDQYYEEPGNRVWGRIYTCTHNGPFTLQAGGNRRGPVRGPAAHPSAQRGRARDPGRTRPAAPAAPGLSVSRLVAGR